MGCHHRTQSPKLHLHRTMTLFPQTPSSHSAGHRRRQVSPPAPKKLHTCAALIAAYAPAESQPSGQTPVYRHLCCRRGRRCCALGSFTRPGQRWRGTSAPCPCPRLWHHSVGIRDRNRGVQTLGPEFFVCFSSLSAGAAELTCRIHGVGIARGLIHPSWRRTEGVSGARRSVYMAGCRLPAT